VAALFVKMPYYGPRRQPDVKARMVSLDPHETVRGMTQAVLDVRQATAWLGSRAEIDGDQLGILGISLGGITAALASSAEPRLQNICLILAGGDIGEVAWNAPHLKKLRANWEAAGGTKESLIELLRPVDPATNAAKARGRRILMLNAAEDEVIPPACTKSLWQALGQPEIVWWNAGHYSAAQYIFEGLARAVRFFSERDAAAEPAAK
jgi:dienelactone hydrolase